jgi:hypothetical protein
MINIGQLPASGGIVLRSNVSDWKHIVSSKGAELREKALIKIGSEEKEVDIIIEEFFEPNSLGANVWILVGYLLGDKRTPIVITHSHETNETFYAFGKHEDKNLFPIHKSQ